jgi:molybdopterin synthase catalytic subunit
MVANITLTKAKLDVTGIREAAKSPKSGAIIIFEGCTRSSHDGRSVKVLAYEAFIPMAKHELGLIRQEAIDLYKLDKCLIHHRLGEVPLMEAALVVACSAAHRREALEATTWIIDRIKLHVPIWKCEEYVDGAKAWVEGINRQE